MEYIVREILEPTENELYGICNLWSECFSDDIDFIKDFYRNMPVHSTVCCFFNDIPVSMAVLLDAGKGYYGYAVCTREDHRKKGLCRRIHDYIREKCESEQREYFVHPATEDLCSYYKRMGMKESLSYYEVRTVSCDIADTFTVDPSEYSRIRELYFGGYSYYPWCDKALENLVFHGLELRGAYIDGCECAAAVEGDTILELCAPDYLYGKAACAFLYGRSTVGKVRFMSEATPFDRTALMSFSGSYIYFNLFFE